MTPSVPEMERRGFGDVVWFFVGAYALAWGVWGLLWAVAGENPADLIGAIEAGRFDEVDAALTQLVYAACLPRRLEIEKLTRGWYRLSAPADRARGLRAGRSRRVHLALSGHGLLVVRASDHGVPTSHPVDFLLRYLEELACEDAAAAGARALTSGGGVAAPAAPAGTAGTAGASPPRRPAAGADRPRAAAARSPPSPPAGVLSPPRSARMHAPASAAPVSAAPRHVFTRTSTAHSTTRASTSVAAQPHVRPVASATPVATISIDDLQPDLGPRIPVAIVDLQSEE